MRAAGWRDGNRVGAKHLVTIRRKTGRWARVGQVSGAALLVLAVPLGLLAGRAGAQTQVNGPVTLTATDEPSGTPVTDGTPYSSGQEIDITVAANSTIDASNLSSFGFGSEPPMHVLMCSDYQGTSGNLPTTASGNCQGDTEASTPGPISSDGSFTLNNYKVYALPDNILFSEGTSTPDCGLAPYYCVLYIGPDQNSFTDPKLFSAPFQVQANDDDAGESPGDGTPEAPLMIGLPLLGLAVGGSTLYLRRRRQTKAA